MRGRIAVELVCLFAWVMGLCSSAGASLTFNPGVQVAVPAGNLVTNFSFENGAPAPGFANQLFWATGTADTPFASPPGWITSGATQTYAQWGSDGVVGQGINFSDLLPDGKAGLYFGNGLTTVSPAPIYQPDGRVNFASPPTFTPAYGGPCILSQAVAVSPGTNYVLNFWVSGEEAVNPSPSGSIWGEGVFGLKVFNVLPGDPINYLSVPSATSANPSRRYEYFFTPLNPSFPVTIEFINYGHIGTTTPTTTELVLDDVIVNESVPEPASGASVLLAGAIVLAGRRRRRD